MKNYFLIVGLLGALFSGKWVIFPLGVVAYGVVVVCQQSNQHTSQKMEESRTPVGVIWWMLVGLTVIVVALGVFLVGLGGVLIVTEGR